MCDLVTGSLRRCHWTAQSTHSSLLRIRRRYRMPPGRRCWHPRLPRGIPRIAAETVAGAGQAYQ